MSNAYIFSRINTKTLASKLDVSVHVAAAYGKCIALDSIFAHAIGKSMIVTVPVVNSPRMVRRLFTISSYVENGRNILQLPSIGVPVLDRIIALFSFLLFLMIRGKKGDVVVLYNHFPEYVFSVLYAKFRSIKIVLDIEDAPRHDESGLRGILSRMTFKLHRSLKPVMYLAASKAILHTINTNRGLVVYGVSNTDTNSDKKSKLTTPSELRISFGGAMMKETGLDLFLKTLSLLVNTSNSLVIPLHFLISGFGELERLKTGLSSIRATEQIRWTFLGELNFEEYQEIFQSCEIGLCLKDPFTEIGATTFPSKAVEITKNGLLLITSAVSDIPIIFTNKIDAIILKEYTPDCLANELITIANNHDDIHTIATQGQKNITKLTSVSEISKKIYDLIY